MKPFNFKKFVLITSLSCLVIGFSLNYFREPSREEKVLKALNYDLRFTDKVAVEKTRMPSNETNSASPSAKKPTSRREIIDFLKSFPLSDKSYGSFVEVSELVAIKNPENHLSNLSIKTYEGYYFFSTQIDLTTSLNSKKFRVVFDPKTERFGFLTGNLEIVLRDFEDKEALAREYNLTNEGSFPSIKTIYSSPNNPDELIQINSRMKNDGRILENRFEIIQRFPKKQ